MQKDSTWAKISSKVVGGLLFLTHPAHVRWMQLHFTHITKVIIIMIKVIQLQGHCTKIHRVNIGCKNELVIRKWTVKELQWRKNEDSEDAAGV